MAESGLVTIDLVAEKDLLIHEFKPKSPYVKLDLVAEQDLLIHEFENKKGGESHA